MEEIYKVKIRGVKPLLIHAPFGIGDKPKLRRGEHLEGKVEAEGYLYKDDEGKIVVPAMNVKACLREAGRNYKVSGRKSSFASMIRAGLEIRPVAIPLIHNEWKVDTRTVVIQRQRIPRSRPRFDEWGLEFEVINKDPTVIHKETLQNIVIDAGKYCGLGDFRPEFGLFEVEKFELQDYEARRGKARSGLARRGGARVGVARCGEARQGEAGQGVVA